MYGIILHSYMGIFMNHYEDPYETTSIMESKRFIFVVHMSYAAEASIVGKSKGRRAAKCWNLTNGYSN